MLPRRHWAMVLLAGLACACSKTTDSSNPGSESDAGVDASPEGAAIHGSVLDVAGDPLPAALALCAEACWVAFTDDEGDFAYQGLPEGPYKLDVRATAEANGAFSGLSFPLQLSADEDLVLSAPLVLPETGGGILVQAGVQEAQIDDQLRLTIDGDQLELPMGLQDAYLAGVRVAAEHWPPNESPAGTVLAQWALNPFGATSNTPIEAVVENEFGLPADEPIHFYSLDEHTGLLELEAAGQVSADGLTLAATSGQGLSRLTWLIVVSPP
jgi:hypothetical protein